MKVSELKQLLKDVPDSAEIILSVNGHDMLCDTITHGKAILALVEIDHDTVLVFSATDCGFDPSELNYSGLKLIKYLERGD